MVVQESSAVLGRFESHSLGTCGLQDLLRSGCAHEPGQGRTAAIVLQLLWLLKWVIQLLCWHCILCLTGQCWCAGWFPALMLPERNDPSGLWGWYCQQVTSVTNKARSVLGSHGYILHRNSCPPAVWPVECTSMGPKFRRETTAGTGKVTHWHIPGWVGYCQWVLQQRAKLMVQNCTWGEERLFPSLLAAALPEKG